MRLLSRLQDTLIGIDLEGRVIRAAQLVRSGGRWSLAAALALPRMSGEAAVGRAEVGQLVGSLGRMGFRGNRVVLGVPEEKILTGVLELPPKTSGAPLQEIARSELATMHGYDLQAAESVCWDLPTSTRRGSTQAMGVACRHTDAEAVLETFDRSGLDVVALDSRLHAVTRACEGLLPQAGIAAILDMEWNRTMLLLLYQGAVIYKRTVTDQSLQQLAKGLMQGLDLEEDSMLYLLAEVGLTPQSPEYAAQAETIRPLVTKYLDSVAASLQSPFAYATSQYAGTAMESLLLVGQGAAIPGVSEHLQPRLGVSVRVVRPADMVQCPASLGGKAQDPSLAVAIGLARFSDE
ncbi:MAG: pilus assembly protein PilM [Planctomycetota bacterium]|nr:pilus assembly protein PilM [Planctomycetota bacterium]